jgi:hypothetical protein
MFAALPRNLIQWNFARNLIQWKPTKTNKIGGNNNGVGPQVS